jgi:hypothetical protein
VEALTGEINGVAEVVTGNRECFHQKSPRTPEAGAGFTARKVAQGGIANCQRYRVLENVSRVIGRVAGGVAGSTSSGEGT